MPHPEDVFIRGDAITYTDERYYEPFIADDGRVGYRVVSLGADGAETFIYLNPSDGPTDRDVFVYEGGESDPALDNPLHFYDVGADWEAPERTEES